MRRSQLLIFLIKFFYKFYKLNFESKDTFSNSINFMLRSFVRNYSSVSSLVLDREEIRGSKALNELLYDNIEGIQELYNEAKKVKGKKAKKLNFERVVNFFSSIKEIRAEHLRLETQAERLWQEYFTFSKMTVWTEQHNNDKYNHL